MEENRPAANNSYLHQSAYLNYGFTIDETMKKIRQDLQRRLNEQGFDVTVEQWVVLDRVYVSNNSGISQNDIADSTFKDAPTVTRILDQLCKKGLVRREMDGRDRRRFNIFLTETGQQQVELMLPIVMQLRRDGWAGLDEHDYRNLIRILNTIFANLD